jgi:hypothetical protein
MPYLHWATSGDGFDHRNAVIRELTEKFKDPEYRRPTLDEIEAEGETSTKIKLLRAFLQPRNDKCLHIRRTLDQYYYSTSTDADERTVDQIVYKFAKKQHRRKLEEAERAVEDAQRAKEEMRRGEIEWWETRKWERAESSLESSRSRSDTESDRIVRRARHAPEEKRAEASWDPPKVIMVNQLWMWIIDDGELQDGFFSKLC